LEPPPTTVLLSVEQAKAQQRAIVERFFFPRLKGEDSKHVRRLLVRCPASAFGLFAENRSHAAGKRAQER
jgi:hypothetical protein